MRRQLTRARRGITMIEVMVSMSILAVMLAAGMPYYAEYASNAKLREGGMALFTEAMAAQSEAIRRNTQITLTVNGTGITVTNPGNGDAVLRTRDLGRDLYASFNTVTFTGSGAVLAGVGVEMPLYLLTNACSAEVRCPKLRVEPGGGLKLCGNHLGSTC